LAGQVKNPSFLNLHPTKPVLYAAMEIGDFNGQKAGGVAAFAIDPATLTLEPLNQQPSGGQGPCYVAVDPTGRAALVANYGGCTVASLPVNGDGSLGAPASVEQHTGSGPNAGRQKNPHAHSFVPAPGGKFALAANLGNDSVFVYAIDPATAKLTPATPPFVKAAPGAGPRHIAFAPDGRFVYVVNELNNTVCTYAWSADAGTLREVQTITTLPADFAADNTTAEVAVHPSGRFVYASNRGHNSIAGFKVDPQNGTLISLGHWGTQGDTPRHFAIDPGGRFLVVANQRTNNLVAFRVDAETGMLEPTGSTAKVASPTCVRFLPAR
jgi:6-phosphogluconolactonase